MKYQYVIYKKIRAKINGQKVEEGWRIKQVRQGFNYQVSFTC